MPELPEVETTVLAIRPIVTGLKIRNTIIRNENLRWKVPKVLKKLKHTPVHSVERRAKYILLKTNQGIIMIHLGMSGHLSILNSYKTPQKHDHIDFIFNNDIILRYTDPRRFGSIHFIEYHASKLSEKQQINKIYNHPLLNHLGPEPLSKTFNDKYLFKITRNRKTSIKQFIMNSTHVVGVGNIYANEALFLAKISPLRKACHLTEDECKRLVKDLKKVLRAAIIQGGTTLRDFLSPNGKTGYFTQKLLVYGRENLPCIKCSNLILMNRDTQRSTFYCPKCQQ